MVKSEIYFENSKRLRSAKNVLYSVLIKCVFVNPLKVTAIEKKIYTECLPTFSPARDPIPTGKVFSTA
jgi:hypothetical protein